MKRFELNDDLRDLFEELGGDIDVNARIFSGVANTFTIVPIKVGIRF